MYGLDGSGGCLKQVDQDGGGVISRRARGGGMTRRQEGRDGEEGSEVSGPWREVSKKWRRSACEIVRSGGFRGNPNLALPHAAIYVV